MVEQINANPTVLDVSELPRRGDQADYVDKENIERSEEILYQHRLQELSLLTDYETLYDIEDTPVEGLNALSLIKEESNISIQSSSSNLEPIDAQEIYDLTASISDPEHPLTLGQLAVVNLNDIEVKNASDKSQIGEILLRITPTISQCSLATLIGLGIRVRLDRCLPKRFRITILLKEGTHQTEKQVNKQLNDKERVSAAAENPQLLKVISNMLSSCE